MRHILTAVSGETPQIITETVYALLTRQEPVLLSEVHVVTTLRGHKALQDHLLDPEEGQFWKLWDEYGSGPPPSFSLEETVHVLKGADDKDLEDIRTSEENGQARRQIFDLVRRLTSDPEVCLHGSIAGGRKSMGFLLGAAMQFFGRRQDRLYHVLVRPAEVEGARDFFYIPLNERRFEVRGRATQPSALESVQTFSSADVRIDLAELSYLSVRDLVRVGEDGDILYSLTQEEIKDHLRIREEYKRLQARQGEIEELIGNSLAMRRVKEQIIQIAETEATVVIQGETGTGKELAAKAIHEQSERKDRPFVPLNCGALPGELAEAELFGAIRGAYTGSVRDREGAFKAANKGTLFLDEIGDLSPENQGKLLRALQERRRSANLRR